MCVCVALENGRSEKFQQEAFPAKLALLPICLYTQSENLLSAVWLSLFGQRAWWRQRKHLLCLLPISVHNGLRLNHCAHHKLQYRRYLQLLYAFVCLPWQARLSLNFTHFGRSVKCSLRSQSLMAYSSSSEALLWSQESFAHQLLVGPYSLELYGPKG